MASNAFNIAMTLRADVSNAKAGVTDLATAMRGFTAESEKAGSVTKVKAQDLEKLARAAANAALSQEDLAASERRAAEARARAAAVPLNVFANPGSAQPTTALINTVVADMTKGASAANQAWRAAETSVASCQTAVLGLNNSIGAQAHEMVEVAAATQRHQATLDNLRASFSPMFAALLQYERQLDRIDLALKSNVISEAEASAAVAEAARERARAGQIGGGAGASSFYAGNIAAQGFDVGVTAAMGMSPAMIGLQQGTQLAQVAQSMGGGMTAIKGIGAGLLSIINPLSLATIGFTALAAVGIQALMKIIPTTKSAKEVIDDLAGSVDRVTEAMTASRRSMLDLAKEFGDGADDAKRLLDVMAEIEIRSANRTSEKAMKSVYKEIGGGWSTYGLEGAFSLGYLRNFFDERPKDGTWGLSAEDTPNSNRVYNAAVQLDQARRAGDVDAQIAAANELQKAYLAAAEASGKITEEEDKGLAAIGEMILGLTHLKGLKENAAGKAEAADIARSLEEQLVLEQASLRFGEDSAELAAIRAGYEMEELQRKLESLGLTEEQVRETGVLGKLYELQAAREEALLAAQKEQAQVRQDGIDALTRELSLLGSSSAAQIRTNALAEAEIEIRKEKLGLMEAEERRASALAAAEARIALERGKSTRDLQAASIRDGYDLRAGLARDPRIRADIEAEREYVSQIRDGVDPAQARGAADRVRARALNDLTLAQDQFAKSQGEAIQRQQVELALIGQTAEVRARVLALMEAEQQIQQNGASGEMAETMRRNALVQAELAQTIEAQTSAWASVQSAGEAAVDGVLDKLRGGDVKGALAEFIGEIEKGFFDLAIRNPLKNALLGTNLGTWEDVGGWSGVWGRLTGQNKIDEGAVAKAGAMPIQSMAVTAANVTLAGNLSGIGAGIGFSNTNAAPFAGSASLGGSNDVQAQVWQFFAGKGMAPHHIAGIMGNVQAESGFNPTIPGDNGNAVGLFQHNGPRMRGLLNAIGGSGNLGNVQAQLDYVWQELMTSERPAYNRLVAQPDARSAANAFMHGFERPSMESRVKSGPVRENAAVAAESAFSQMTQAAQTATQNVSQLGTDASRAGTGMENLGAGMGQFGGQLGQMLSGLAGAVGGKTGGILQFVLGIGTQLAGGAKLFRNGGFTGAGDPDQAAGIVHAGEYVFDAEATRRIGIANLEGIRRGGMRGFRDGGFVGTAPMLGRAANSGAPVQSGGDHGRPVFQINVNGARGNAEISEMVQNGVQSALETYDRLVMPRRVQGVINDARDVG